MAVCPIQPRLFPYELPKTTPNETNNPINSSDAVLSFDVPCTTCPGVYIGHASRRMMNATQSAMTMRNDKNEKFNANESMQKIPNKLLRRTR